MVKLWIILGFVVFGVGCGSDDVAGLVETCDSGTTEDVCRVFEIVNQERVRAGQSELRFDPALAEAAQRHAVDMAEQDYFSHSSLDGRTFSDRVGEATYDGFPTGENIAFGQRDADSVMVSWMNSSGHRNNILSPNSNEIGVGLHETRWVQVFGVR